MKNVTTLTVLGLILGAAMTIAAPAMADPNGGRHFQRDRDVRQKNIIVHERFVDQHRFDGRRDRFDHRRFDVRIDQRYDNRGR